MRMNGLCSQPRSCTLDRAQSDYAAHEVGDHTRWRDDHLHIPSWAKLMYNEIWNSWNMVNSIRVVMESYYLLATVADDDDDAVLSNFTKMPMVELVISLNYKSTNFTNANHDDIQEKDYLALCRLYTNINIFIVYVNTETVYFVISTTDDCYWHHCNHLCVVLHVVVVVAVIVYNLSCLQYPVRHTSSAHSVEQISYERHLAEVQMEKAMQ